MARQLERGAGNLDAFLILAFVIFVMLVSPRSPSAPGSPGGFEGLFSGPTLSSSSSGGLSAGKTLSSASNASPRRSLSIASGNAPYEHQPYKEYIEVSNWGGKPIDITGWTLKNGKDKRSYDVYGTLQRFSADIARIPQAAALLLPSGNSPMQDVVLENGERAIITTGFVSVNSPYKISSFKENSCTGYLERLPDYSFEPPLQLSCPRPSQEPGIENLDTACRLFVERLSTCATPEFEAKDAEGEPCATCLQGRRLSSSCAAFIKEHFSYRGCIAYHAGDPSFSSGRTWRIFLGRTWEMWAENYETIELFDTSGNLAAFINYR